MMDHCNGNGHVAEDSKGRNASEEPEDKTQSTEEFRRNCQSREWGRNVHHAGEEAHRAGETISTEPPERLLGAVREKHHSQDQPKKRYDIVVVRGDQLAN